MVISAFLSGTTPAGVMEIAKRSFRGVPFSELHMLDLQNARENTGREDGDTLAKHSVPVKLGHVDCFISHAWTDDPVPPRSREPLGSHS